MSRCLIAAAALVLAATTYAAEPQPTSRPFVAADAIAAARDYTIDPPDEIILHCPGKAEFDNQKRKVAADGIITLPMVGEVNVAGLTTDACSKRLKELVSKYYVDPQLTIEVINNSKFYYVVGEGVNEPGPKICTGRDTVVQALIAAGASADAWPQQVWLSRPRKDGLGRGTQVVVDFKKIFEDGDLSQNYLLEKSDIVNVPKSPLDALKVDLSKFQGPTTNPTTFGPSNVIVRPGKTGP